MPVTFKRISSERDRLIQGPNMPMRVDKQPDGQFKAVVTGQEHMFAATGPTEMEALQALKTVVRDTWTKGELGNINQRMV
jgi:hypothetical protein